MDPVSIFLAPDSTEPTLPLWTVRPATVAGLASSLSSEQMRWLDSIGFKGEAKKVALLPGADGALAGAVVGLGDAAKRPAEPDDVVMGLLPGQLPAKAFHLAEAGADATLAAVAWGLGAYRFRRYKAGNGSDLARLRIPAGADRRAVEAIVGGVHLGRDLINTPSNDMGPAELEAAARDVAQRFGAKVTSIVGDALLEQNFPLIHAVGRASPRAPRLIDIVAGREGAPKVTIVGKGICFDTGGLDIKPASAMLLMKKDMGGAATALALAHMILSLGLDVRLRVLLPTAENSIAGNAFRPGDVIRSRAGKTVEIGNTDAEGRLVLADALAFADEDRPDHLISFATLTGAARVAVGPELAPYFTTDDATAQALESAGLAVGDPLWRLPFTAAYQGSLDSPVADMNNVSEGGFAGAIVAAVFLERFVTQASRYTHFDIWGWRAAGKALGPKGGETNAARAVLEMLQRTYGR
ncbi:MAG: leucyl aminopeptidase family protein [Hyphomicrobiaceae bacterium]